MKYRWVDHVVIAVNNVKEAAEEYKSKLGLTPTRYSELPEQGLRNAVIDLEQRFIELVEPTGPETPIGRFLARKGEGFYLVALAVDNLQKAAQELKDKGVQLIDQNAGGRRYVFLHPRNTHGVLFQLVERK